MVGHENTDGWALWLKRSWQWDGLVLISGGTVVLIGWFLGSDVLKRIHPAMVAMNPITALGFITAGASLLCVWQTREHSRGLSELGRLLAILLVGIGALKLVEYVFGWRIGFDQLLFRAQLKGDPTGFANQIAPNTAFNFMLGGLALWFLNGSPRGCSKSAQNLSLTLALVSLVPLVGYLYQASYLYSVGSQIPMALHTALFFFLLAGGSLLAQAETGVVALFMSKTPGGAIARRLLPFALVVPVVLGALQIWGEKDSLFRRDFGVTLMVVGCVGTFVSLTWRTAVLLNRSDDKRRQAEEKLQKAHDELEARVQERTAEVYQSNEALRVQIAELQRAEERIREQAELIDKARDAIMVLDLDGRILYWNKGAELLYGWNLLETTGKSIRELLVKNGSPASDLFDKVLNDGGWSGEVAHLTKAGNSVTVESRWTLVKDALGRAKSILLIDTDITEKKHYEAQMLRSQRMDSIGALAGGIAHDLNNALSPVLMSAEILKEGLDEAQREKFLDVIISSTERGIQMVKQILSFARGSRSESGPVPILQLVGEMGKIIQDTFPKSITISIQSRAKAEWKVQGDATELHQILLNLCVNARDAMPKGGQLTLSVDNVRLEGKSLPTNNTPGPYVLLAVTDTGTGIPPEVLPRIFEPFFTTKSADKGTGLGLSTVAGIVKHSGGFLDIKTEPGRGTEFRIYLPAIETSSTAESKPEKSPPPEGHGELVLVMDDEEAVRELTKSTLENYGYRVITALNGLHGIAQFEKHKDEIKLIVSDSDMPYLDGVSAICSIRQLKPNVPVIIASGAKHDLKDLHRIDATNVANLGKPFGLNELLATVATLINHR